MKSTEGKKYLDKGQGGQQKLFKPGKGGVGHGAEGGPGEKSIMGGGWGGGQIASILKP